MIENDRYRWLVTESESWREIASGWVNVLEGRRLTLVVQHPSGRGQKLLAWVPVYRTPIELADVAVALSDRVTLKTPSQETVVSPALVRRVIEYALRCGWKPSARRSDFVVPEDVLRTLINDSFVPP